MEPRMVTIRKRIFKIRANGTKHCSTHCLPTLCIFSKMSHNRVLMSPDRWFDRSVSNTMLPLNMNNSFRNYLLLTLSLLVVLGLPGPATAQIFNFNTTGDVLAGFRKMNSSTLQDQGGYELVVNLGSVTNLLSVPAGSTITLSNVNYSALTNTFFDTAGSEPVLSEIQWSAFGAVPQQPGSGRNNYPPLVTPL